MSTPCDADATVAVRILPSNDDTSFIVDVEAASLDQQPLTSMQEIEAFALAHSDMESLVGSVKKKQEHHRHVKGRVCTTFASMLVIVFFGCVIASVIQSSSSPTSSLSPSSLSSSSTSSLSSLVSSSSASPDFTAYQALINSFNLVQEP